VCSRPLVLLPRKTCRAHPLPIVQDGVMSTVETQTAGADLVDQIRRYGALAESLLGMSGGAPVPVAGLDDVRRFYAGGPDTSLVHRDGPVRSLHVPLSTDGGDSTGFLAQPGLVAEVVESTDPVRSVVELGCAEGFNTAYLAERFPEVAFTGYDLVPEHIAAATARLADVANTSFAVADFHHLPVPAGSADVVFSVESIIHSTDMERVLGQAFAALRPGGALFAIELFRKDAGWGAGDAELERARAVTETLLAIPAMHAHADFLALAGRVGFDHVTTTDLTAAALPKMQRLSKLFARVLDRGGNRTDAELRSMLTGLLICRTLQVGAHALFAVRLAKR
jgi:SAM-dependent methyltransferase